MKDGPTIPSLFVTLALVSTAIAQDAAPKSSVLITNADIFDGQHEALATGMSVLVEGRASWGCRGKGSKGRASG